MHHHPAGRTNAAGLGAALQLINSHQQAGLPCRHARAAQHAEAGEAGGRADVAAGTCVIGGRCQQLAAPELNGGI